MKIGNVTLENNIILAPMAGVTDLPFRLLCKEQGAGLLCMEMVSAKAIYYNNKNKSRGNHGLFYILITKLKSERNTTRDFKSLIFSKFHLHSSYFVFNPISFSKN